MPDMDWDKIINIMTQMFVQWQRVDYVEKMALKSIQVN